MPETPSVETFAPKLEAIEPKKLDFDERASQDVSMIEEGMVYFHSYPPFC